MASILSDSERDFFVEIHSGYPINTTGISFFRTHVDQSQSSLILKAHLANWYAELNLF